MMNSKLFEFSEIEMFTGGDEKLMYRLMKLFISTSRIDMDRLYQAIDNKNIEACKSVAHKLCTTYAYFTNCRVKEVMSQILVNMNEEKNFQHVEFLMAHINNDIQQLDSLVSEYLSFYDKLDELIEVEAA